MNSNDVQWPMPRPQFLPSSDSAPQSSNPSSMDYLIDAWKRESLAYKVLRPAAIGVCVFHGYRRNSSVLWGIVWGLCGAVFPLVAPAIAVAQGLGKAKK